jgi:hypothetical protein
MAQFRIKAAIECRFEYNIAQGNLIALIISANEMASMHPRIGFIGIGLRDLGMALRLRHSGYTLNTWNREPPKCAPIVMLSAKQSSP